MKKPEITRGEWKFGANIVGEHEIGTAFVVGAHPMIASVNSAYFTKKERENNARAISAVPDLIEEAIKAYEELYKFWHQSAIDEGQSDEVAEAFAKEKTKGLRQALIKAGCKP